MLRRDGDPAGVANYVQHLVHGTLTPDGVLDEMLTSMELRDNVPYQNRLRSLHLSRCDFVRMLPRARRILDLGGTDLDNRVGSLVAMGYPYAFQQLTIVDLPHGDRHELYQRSDQHERVESHLGPVEYRYHSMADLSDYADASFDMVFSGESIEHITEAEARVMVHEVRRVLEPGGWFCLDTPNRRATEIELGDDYSNPDHKIEYTDCAARHVARRRPASRSSAATGWPTSASRSPKAPSTARNKRATTACTPTSRTATSSRTSAARPTRIDTDRKIHRVQSSVRGS